MDDVSDESGFLPFTARPICTSRAYLIKLLTLPRSDRFTLRLWRHLADQTRHASLWSEHLELLGTHNRPLDINALCDRVHRQKAHGEKAHGYL